MTGPATGTVTTLTGIAAAMSIIPSGIPGILIAFGAIAFFAGCSCRTGITLYAKLNGNDAITLPWFVRQIAMLLCCVPLSLVASAVLFLAALVAGTDVNKDAPAVWGLLLLMGIRGPEGFQWITDTAGNIFMRVMPGQQKPPTGGGGTP